MKLKCFTMLEMVVVIVIIATLAAVATPMYFNHVKSSRINAAKMQINMFEQAIFNYQLDLKKLPTQLDDLITNNQSTKRWKGPYLKITTLPMDPWGNEYIYIRPGSKSEYDLICYGADGTEGGEDDNADITNWTSTQE